MIHKYFKREFEEFTILIQLNPETYSGLELTIEKSGEIQKRELQFDSDIYEDLEVDDFKPSSPLEFNLFLKGIN